MSKIDFDILINKLSTRLEKEKNLSDNENENEDENDSKLYYIYKGQKIKKCKDDGMDVSLFSSDILIQILSFLSFKRICRMATLSSRISNASQEHSLWEILYKKKFKNFIFENILKIDDNDRISNEIIWCKECSMSLLCTLKKKKLKKEQACHFECKKHCWLDLFKVKNNRTYAV